jgi:hypothetical protein
MARTGNFEVTEKSRKHDAKVRQSREAAVLHKIRELQQMGFVRISRYPMYLINTCGVVYSTLLRRVKAVSPGIKPGGYEFVGLHDGPSAKYEMVHRLVAETFIPNLAARPQINHKDGNKRNNHAHNLEWCTCKENIRHAFRNGLYGTGSNSPRAKLTAEQVREIRASTGGTYRQIGKKFGVSAQTVCNVKCRSKYQDVA